MNLILLVGAIAVAWLVFTALMQIVKTTLTTALTVTAIVLVLALGFGIGPDQLITQIQSLPQSLWELVQGKGK